MIRRLDAEALGLDGKKGWGGWKTLKTVKNHLMPPPDTRHTHTRARTHIYFAIHGHHHQGISNLYTIICNVIYKMCSWFYSPWWRNQEPTPLPASLSLMASDSLLLKAVTPRRTVLRVSAPVPSRDGEEGRNSPGNPSCLPPPAKGATIRQWVVFLLKQPLRP